MLEVLKKLDSTYFWDVDLSKLDIEKSRRLIIERVINLGNLEEIRLIRKYWGDRKIKEILCNLNFLDPKTLNFVSLLFDIPNLDNPEPKREKAVRSFHGNIDNNTQ